MPLTAEELRQSVVFAARYALEMQLPGSYFLGHRAVSPYKATDKKHWCGLMALWCLHEAGLTTFRWLDSRGYIFYITPRLKRTTKPRPGDTCYQNKPWQHYSTVEEVRDDGTVVTIDGNQGDPGVQRREHKDLSKLAFFSIQPLVDAMLEPTEPAEG